MPCELDSNFYNLFEREIAKNPFGCIELPDSDPISGWHTLGSFNDSNEFIISNFRINEIINSHFTLCPLFDKEYAISQIDEIPDKIIPDNINWSIGETLPYMEDYRRLGVIPYSFKKTNFGYINKEAVDRSVNLLQKAVKDEIESANYDMREANQVNAIPMCMDDCCNTCKKLRGKVFRADILLENWKNERLIPIPVLGCEHDICRCYWNIDIDKKNTHSYLPPLTEEQKVLIEKDKISVVFEGFIYKGRENFIKMGSQLIGSISFMWIPVFDKIDLDEAYIVGLSPIIRSLQKYNYAKIHNLDTMKMWGFCLKKSISGEVIIYVLDDFIELNRFERLSKFNPKTAKWITDE